MLRAVANSPMMHRVEKAAAFLEGTAMPRSRATAWASPRGKKRRSTRDKVAYIAIPRIQSSMLNGSRGVKVEGPYSGALYAQNLRGGQADTTGAPVHSESVPVATGRARQFANPDKIAPPCKLNSS